MENFWIFFAIFALVVVTLAIIIRSGEPPRDDCENEENEATDQAANGEKSASLNKDGQAENRGKKAKHAHKKRRIWSDWTPTEKFTLVLAISSLGYFVAYCMWVYLDQRAVISVPTIDKTQFAENQRLKITIGLLNVGRTTARHVTVSIGTLIAKTDPGRNARDILVPLPGEIELPQQRLQMFLYEAPGTISHQQFVDATNPQSGVSLIVAMRFKYWDVFGLPHTYTTCNLWFQPVNSFTLCIWNDQ